MKPCQEGHPPETLGGPQCTREAGRLGMEGQGSPGGRRGQTRPGPSQGCTVTGTFIVVSGSESGAVHTQASLGLSCSGPHFPVWDLPGRASLSLAHPSFGPDLPKPKRSAALGSCGPPKTNSLTVFTSPTPYTYVQHQEPHGTKLWGADAKLSRDRKDPICTQPSPALACPAAGLWLCGAYLYHLPVSTCTCPSESPSHRTPHTPAASC